MTTTTFFRLLKTPIDTKGETLAAQIATLNAAGQAEQTFTFNPADFSLIPGSPFGYWVSTSIRRLFADLPKVESEEHLVRMGDHPDDQDRYVRLFWEVPPTERGTTRQWLPYQKGGIYSPYYADIHLRVDWDLSRETYYDFYGRPGRSNERPSNYQLFFRPGLTWPRRTNDFGVRIMPEGCVFADKGPVVIAREDDLNGLLSLLAVMNSAPFGLLVALQLDRTELARSYNVGLVQRTPIPCDRHDVQYQLGALAREAHDLQRDRDRSDETTHAFCLPAMLTHRVTGGAENSLQLCALRASVAEESRQARLAAIQAEIDELAFDLYGLGEADRALVRAEMGGSHGDTADSEEELYDLGDSVADPDEDEEPTAPEDLPARVQNLLMWCVGVAFGRWNVRFALDPALLPALQGPFDPLPRCAPGALVSTDGLPPTAAGIAPVSWLRARKDVLDLPAFPVYGEKPEPEVDYPLPVAWNGILVDDSTHPADIVTRVGQVLRLLWGERAGAIEREACDILGYKTLRDYFRDPRQGFFAFHIKRYSKSRRKAPIYWLLQSERRNYAIWLYCHRLDHTSLYTAGRDYADVKLALEQGRLDELRQGLEVLAGSARKQQEREADRQAKLVAEVADFRRRLDAAALLNVPPDLNDGVLISVAPLWELMPWKEAQRTWEKLRAGEYAWSTMARQMRERGLVK